MKPEVRVIGLDDGTTRRKRRTVIGAVFRGGLWLDGITTSVLDVKHPWLGRVLASMVTESKFCKELRFAILHGSMLSYLKHADLTEFNLTTRLPTIAILRKTQTGILSKQQRRGRDDIHFRLKNGDTALCLGLTRGNATEILRITTPRGIVPEPIRVAGLIASVVNAQKD